MNSILAGFERAIRRSKRALEGDSNDAEHDALVELLDASERMQAALTEPVKDILGKLRWDTAFPPVALYDQERDAPTTTNDSQE